MRAIVRERILKKFNNKCCYCGSTSNLEIDHIIPLSKGGKHDEKNFQILCRACNRKKSNTLDIRQFFRSGDGKTYMMMSREICDIWPRLTDHELKAIVEQMFSDLCDDED